MEIEAYTAPATPNASNPLRITAPSIEAALNEADAQGACRIVESSEELKRVWWKIDERWFTNGLPDGYSPKQRTEIYRGWFHWRRH